MVVGVEVIVDHHLVIVRQIGVIGVRSGSSLNL